MIPPSNYWDLSPDVHQPTNMEIQPTCPGFYTRTFSSAHCKHWIVTAHAGVSGQYIYNRTLHEIGRLWCSFFLWNSQSEDINAKSSWPLSYWHLGISPCVYLCKSSIIVFSFCSSWTHSLCSFSSQTVPGGKSSREQGLVMFFLSVHVALPDMRRSSLIRIILKGSQSPHSPVYLQAAD